MITLSAGSTLRFRCALLATLFRIIARQCWHAMVMGTVVLLLLGLISGPAQAQSVSFAGAQIGVSFGNVNVCPGGQTSPAPCSQTLTLNYNVAVTTTFGPINVVTQGTRNLDFTLSSGSTCVDTVTAGSACTVNVTFAPVAPGFRMGAVQLFDSANNLLATTMVNGTGQGSAIAFQPAGAQIDADGRYGGGGHPGPKPNGVAVDAAGDVFVAYEALSQVVEFPAGGGAPIMIGSGLKKPTGVAVDGAGNVFIADQYNNRVVEVPAGGGVQTTIGSGLSYPTGVAVDAAGDVFISDTAHNRVLEVPAGGGAQITVPAIGLNFPQGLAVDGTGNIFIADSLNNQVVEVPADGGAQTAVGSGLNHPDSVAVDGEGNVFIADTNNSRIVEVLTGGGGNQSMVPANQISYPQGVAVDGAGNVFIADQANNRVWEVQQSLPPTLSFPPTVEGNTSGPQSVTIMNIGNQPLDAVTPGLTIGTNFIQVSGGQSDCTNSFVIPSAATCNLSIRFQPQTEGDITGFATLTDNALNLSPSATQNIVLQGHGRSGDVSQTITFTVPAPPEAREGGSFMVAAVASSGLPVLFSSFGDCYNSGATYTMFRLKHYPREGCAVIASQAGDDYYLPAPTVTEGTAIAPGRGPYQTVSFTGAPATAPYLSTFTVVATSNSGLTPTITATGSCAISDTTVTMTTGVGVCELTAEWPSNYLYRATSAHQQTKAKKIASLLTWATPAPIIYGTQLSDLQLDATANVAGAFAYLPAAGTVPKIPKPPATCDTLKVTFTPSLRDDYTEAKTSVCLVVNPD